MAGKPAGSDLRGLFIKAALSPNARRSSVTSVEADFSGNCMNPPSLFKQGGSMVVPSGRISPPAEINLHVRCRKCEACRMANARHWATRSSREISQAPRTWFCTFTLSPEEHIRFQYGLKEHTTEALIAAELKAVERMFKRMRKAGLKLRYMVTAELHDSGLPHFHAFIHEGIEGQITSRMLAGDRSTKPRFWLHGFAKAKLVDTTPSKAAWYVCSYIGKCPMARIRASLKYGGGRKVGL